MPSMTMTPQRNDDSFASIWDEVKWRGLVHVSTDEAALEEALTHDTVTYYCGFDPTAPSLHLGHLVQLLLMRRLQLAGHNPLGLVGGSTGLIGDPRPTAERTLNTPEVVAEWVGYLKGQVQNYLDFEGEHAARMVNNLDWTAPMSAIDFLREIGKHYRVGTMLAKDAVSARLNSDAGISYTEFSYQILQGIDFLELYRQYGCTLQTGGSDQWGNLTSGTDLIRRVEGEAVHAIGTPLITNSDGTKFGKSEGNAIWIDAKMTSPYAFYQFWLNTADADVANRLKVFTFLSSAEIAEMDEVTASRPQAREAQRRLAYDVTSLVHGQDATEKIVEASQALFGRGEVRGLDSVTLGHAIAELPQGTASRDAVAGGSVSVVDALVSSGLVTSKGAARRAISDGGAYVNNERVTDESAVLASDDVLDAGAVLLRRGKKTLGALVVE
ncbi:tyrosyl-tRNA synthetase [Spelaeicoccus albus]|uniref:Tyrosine--tRNA ligase n=2 Tax=Spelaeicoccus albus TaxID=1280376 RepID=A0A7Z0IJ34_9MICO|nr:tyrosyl-tRNA synthetase [Spelaeicoccus albus]